MSSTRRYVCAFRGRRDDYQVPMALVEADRLQAFITDAYATPRVRAAASFLPGGFRRRLARRRQSAIPDERVKCLWGTTAIEQLRHKMGYAPAGTYELLDRNFSYAAAKHARSARADLFLYSAYAWEAFSQTYGHAPRKVLFQYHPHIDTEDRILAEDAAIHSDIFASAVSSLENVVRDSASRCRGDASWQLADHIVCASSFTRDTLVEAGADTAKIKVAPYGVDLPPPSGPDTRDLTFQALFVGSGLQRKGLHHLLLAWKIAVLPPGSHLTVVCRVLDPRLRPLLDTAKGVTVISGLPQEQLEALYRSSSLFVMPSLVEGFGQVYLEALSFGLPVLGTRQTCLPDLGTEGDGVFLIEPGDIEELAYMLERLARTLPQDKSARERARACATRFPWARFRDEIRSVLD